MPRLIVVIILLLSMFYISSSQEKQEMFDRTPIAIDTALTSQTKNAVIYRTSQGQLVFKLKVIQADLFGRVLLFESGSPYENKGALVFEGLSNEEIDYILAQIELYRARKKVKE